MFTKSKSKSSQAQASTANRACTATRRLGRQLELKSQPLAPADYEAAKRDFFRRAGPPARLRVVNPFIAPAGTDADTVLRSTAAKVRAIAKEGRALVPYNPESPESFFEACSRLKQLSYALSDSCADPVDAAVVLGIFERTELFSQRVAPVSETALQSISSYVSEALPHVRTLLLKQADLLADLQPQAFDFESIVI